MANAAVMDIAEEIKKNLKKLLLDFTNNVNAFIELVVQLKSDETLTPKEKKEVIDKSFRNIADTYNEIRVIKEVAKGNADALVR